MLNQNELGITLKMVRKSKQVDYVLEFQNQNINPGRIKIKFKPVGDLMLNQVISDKQLFESLSPNDLCAELYHFFPYGTRDGEPYQKQGLGSKILQEVLQECAEREVKVVYSDTGSSSLATFLERRGFMEIGGIEQKIFAAPLNKIYKGSITSSN